MPTNRTRGEYRLNVRFLGRVLAIVLLICVGVFFLHRYQEKRLISRFLDQADRARDGNEPMKELAYLRQYIGLNPTDSAARVRYGRVMAKHSKNPVQVLEAFFALQKALQTDPNLDPSIRELCVDLALRPDIFQPVEAKRELERLMKDKPNNPDYETKYAMALVHLGERQQAEEFLAQVIGRHKTRLDAFSMLAWLKRDHNRTNPGVAELVITQMLQYPENEGNYRAWLRAAGFYSAFGPPESYARAIDRAVQLAPNEAEVLFAKAEHLLSKWRKNMPIGLKLAPNEQFEEAVGLLKKCLATLQPIPPVEPLPEIGTPERLKLELASVCYRTLAQSYMLTEQYGESEKYAREHVARIPGFLHLKRDLLDVLVRQGKLDEAKKICDEMSAVGMEPAFVELQRGLMAAQQKQWVDAARHLERVVIEVATIPEYHQRASLMLALCYERTNEPDRVLQTLRDAIPKAADNPLWVQTKLAYAEHLAKMNRFDEAVAQIREVVIKDPAQQQLLLRVLIAQRSVQNKPTLDNEIDSLLAKFPDSAQKALWSANYLLAKRQTSAAQKLIDEALQKYPDSTEIRVLRQNLDLRSKDYGQVRDSIEEAEKKFGDTFDVRKMKITLIATEGFNNPERGRDLEALAANLSKFNATERLQLLQHLTNAARAINRRDLARQWLGKMMDEDERGKHDIELHYQAFDLAILDGDDARVQAVLKDIERISGDRNNPTYRLASAFGLIRKAEKLLDNPDERRHLLETAKDLLNGLESTRKEWGKLYLAQAKVNDMLGLNDLAIDRYRRAIDTGERQPEVFTRIIDLLLLAKDQVAISQLLTTYPEATRMLTGQTEQMVATLITTREFTKAIEMARRAVPDDTKDPIKLLWLARVLNACEDPYSAEAVIRKAQKLDPSNGDVFIACIQLLTKLKKKDEAKQIMEEAIPHFKPNETQLLQAQGHTLLENYELAGRAYEEMLKTRGEELQLIRAAGGYYFARGEYGKAAPLMEKILKHPQKSPLDEEIARRSLALCTVVSRDHKSGERALKVLGYSSPDTAASFTGRESLEDLRCRFAVCSVIRGQSARLASVAILREIEKKVKEMSVEDQLAFGQLQFALGDYADALRRLGLAAAHRDSNFVTKAIYANALLRRNNLEEAKKVIDQLTKMEPNSQRTVELAAKYAVMNNRPAEAVDLVKQFANQKDAKPEIAAAILESLGLVEDAGPLYLRAAQAGPPQLWLLYAGYLARVGKPVESFDLFVKHWSTVPVDRAVPLLCESMMHVNPQANPAVVSKAGELIETSVRTASRLRPWLAAFKSVTDQVPEAISLYQQWIAENPNDFQSLNNLALLISLKNNQHEEALAMIRKAVDLIGPQPTLLDSMAVVLTADGKPKDAIEKLRQVICDDPTAIAYMHLAQAYFAAGNVTEARIALREAQTLNLRINDFHPLERTAIRGTLAQLGVKQ